MSVSACLGLSGRDWASASLGLSGRLAVCAAGSLGVWLSWVPGSLGVRRSLSLALLGASAGVRLEECPTPPPPSLRPGRALLALAVLARGARCGWVLRKDTLQRCNLALLRLSSGGELLSSTNTFHLSSARWKEEGRGKRRSQRIQTAEVLLRLGQLGLLLLEVLGGLPVLSSSDRAQPSRFLFSSLIFIFGLPGQRSVQRTTSALYVLE